MKKCPQILFVEWVGSKRKWGRKWPYTCESAPGGVVGLNMRKRGGSRGQSPPAAGGEEILRFDP